MISKANKIIRKNILKQVCLLKNRFNKVEVGSFQSELTNFFGLYPKIH